MAGEVSKYQTQMVDLKTVRLDKSRFPRISHMKREDVVAGIANIVTMAFMYKGTSPDTTNVQFIANELTSLLLADEYCIGSKWITLEEIKRSVKKAVLGGTEMYGISVSNLFKVITDYIKGEGTKVEESIRTDAELRRRRELRDSVVGTMLLSSAGKMFNK